MMRLVVPIVEKKLLVMMQKLRIKGISFGGKMRQGTGKGEIMSEWNEELDNDEETLDAVWCVDSESGMEALIDRKTNKVIAIKRDGKITEPNS